MRPFISVCIPTYNRPEYLEKLLNNIAGQDFQDFNVIISDNSVNDLTAAVAEKFKNLLAIIYNKNVPPVNMAENWNQCLKMADGEWIKMMHDDDSFAKKDSLSLFAAAAKGNCSVIFSAHNIYNNNKIKSVASVNDRKLIRIKKNQYMLFYNNVIGPPSTTMIRNNTKELYDARLTWVVDYDYYIRVLKNSSLCYIPDALVNIMYNDSQVSNDCFGNKEIQVPETLILYEKYGENITDNLIHYNSWWRFVRNLEMRNRSEIVEYSKGYKIPEFIFKIIEFQSYFPLKLLRNGFVSRFLMFSHYLTNSIRKIKTLKT